MKASIPFITCLALLLSAPLASGQQADRDRPASLDELLNKVKQGWREESVDLKKREGEFLAAKSQQQKLLKQAEEELRAAKKRSEELERDFDRNEARIAQMEETLRIRLGTMGELFGVIRQVAGDTRSQLDGSLVSAQYPGRGDKLTTLATSKVLPEVTQLENLWFLLQQEMVESGKIVRFKGKMVTVAGEQREVPIIRVGVFNAMAEGKYLNWLPEVGKLVELGRQPADRYLASVSEFEQAKEGFVRLAVDPSRGSILALLVQTPSFMERIHFGGLIGYIIIAIGAATFLLGILRMIYLLIVGLQIRLQRRRKVRSKRNPLGRILAVHDANPTMDSDTLERKLDEAILVESTRLDRFLWAIKIVSVVAPLLGLLGTVTGMIQTFQSITLFGTGDPKLMAGGISEALVTTMLGLIVAIPLVLLHAWMKSMTKRMVEMLDEQSTGIIARQVEMEKACDVPAD